MRTNCALLLQPIHHRLGLCLLFLIAQPLLAACHTIDLPAPGQIALEYPPSTRTARFVLDADSRELSFGIGATTAGLAHRFRLEVGRSLEAYGRAYCARAFAPGSELELRAEILDFDVEQGAGHLICEFHVLREGHILFEKRYDVIGPPRPGLPGYPLPSMNAGVASEGSVAAVENSLRRTLHDVLTLTLQSFLNDLWSPLNLADKRNEADSSN